MVEVDRPIHYPFEEVISMGEGGGGGGANSQDNVDIEEVVDLDVSANIGTPLRTPG